MLTIALGLVAALVYGFADFFGAVASKTIRPIIVTAVASFSGLVLLLVLSFFMGADYSSGAVFWGVITGIASAIALSCLYAALSLGPISIVSPTTAVVSAIVPAIVGLSSGDHFSIFGWLALAIELVAIILVAFIPGQNVQLPSLAAFLFSLGAGVGIGIVLITLHQAPEDSGLAPVIVLRSVAGFLLVIASVIAVRRAKRAGIVAVAAPAKIWQAVIVTGLFDSLANVFFITAVRIGQLTVVSVLTALYPVGTILLARLVLKEKIAATQMVGILLAIGGSVLLALP
jgi:drug/metabolite transporter (DMT)-like permease